MRRIEFTLEEIEDMRNRYENGESQDSIGRRYNVSRTVIRRVFKNNQISTRTIQEANGKTVPEEIAEKVVYNYCVLKKGLLPSGAPYGLTQFMVEKILKEYGIRKRTYTEAKDGLRKYSVNDDYFKTQSHNMAYILGFLAADGNIAKKENKIDLALAESDKEILEKINQEIENTRPIKIYDRHDGHQLTAKLQVFSSTMKKDLAHYNIVPAKTFILTPPELLAREYIISYIRGFFDGDGSIYYAGTTFTWRVGSASKKILEWMRSFLAEEYGIVNNKLYYSKLANGTDFYYLQYTGQAKMEKLYKALYVPNSLRLQRKYDFFTHYMNTHARGHISSVEDKKIC